MVRDPNLDEEIIGYDRIQTAEINKVADYVIEQVMVTGGSYTKWNSGRLEFNILYGAIEASGVGAHDFAAPTPFISGNAIAIPRTVGGMAYNRFTVHRVLTDASNSTISVGYNSEATSQPAIQVMFDGRWK